LTILGIETSTRICGAALIDENGWIADYHLNQKNVHASKLTDIIDTVLRQGGITVSELSAIAVSIGPGSFTGLRIGLSMAKGLALGGNVPVVAVPTFDALASQAPIQSGLICPVLKSRSFEYFYGVYERQNFINKRIQEPQLALTENIAHVLPNGAMIVGHVEELAQDELLKKEYAFSPKELAKPSALSIARLGLQKFQANDIASFETLEPTYFQEFIAGKPKPR
jgi:tRNA threonylcarbamoyladenosine biosynthesis protein TsaB